MRGDGSWLDFWQCGFVYEVRGSNKAENKTMQPGANKGYKFPMCTDLRSFHGIPTEQFNCNSGRDSYADAQPLNKKKRVATV